MARQCVYAYELLIKAQNQGMCTLQSQKIQYREVQNIMFNFRIINCSDGTQVIDPSLKTPYSALTPVQMTEYQEMSVQIAVMERMKRKAAREEKRRMKRERNLFYKLASVCGLL